MKKYNLSKIMSRAWALVKKSAMTMSAALKAAWAEAKSAVVIITRSVIDPQTVCL